MVELEGEWIMLESLERTLGTWAMALLGIFVLVLPLFASGYPAMGPGTLPDEGLHLTFDGDASPFVPQRVGQKVKVEAWFLGRRVPLDKCKVRFPGNWAKLEMHHSGVYGWLRVINLDISGRDLGPKNKYAYTIELKVASRGESSRGVRLSLDKPYRLHRLDASIELTSGKVKPFDLRTHPDIYPVRPEDVYVWPSGNDVLLWKGHLWVGVNTKEVLWADGRAKGLEPSNVVLIAVKLRQRSGGERWIYTNLMPATIEHRNWDDEVSQLRLPVFPGSAEFYREAENYFNARGVPFDSLRDISHVRGELTGK